MYLFHLALAQTIFRLLDPGVWLSAASRAALEPASPLKDSTISTFETLASASKQLTNYPLLSFVAAFVAVALAAFVVAWLHFRFVERKFMALRPPVHFRVGIAGPEA